MLLVKELENENIAFGICKGCKFCQPNKKCPYMRKHGHYTTKSKERIQRYLCLKTYTTFSKYTKDSELRYLRDRKLPIGRIVESYKSAYSTLQTLSTEYNLAISTIRTVLKRSKINFKSLKRDMLTSPCTNSDIFTNRPQILQRLNEL